MWGLALLVAVAMATPVNASEAIQSVIVKFRDDALPPQASTLPADLQSTLLLSLGTQFAVTGQTRDGAFQLTLTTPMSFVDARAAINRVREFRSVIYANVVDGVPTLNARNSEAATARPPVSQMVIKYRDAAITEAALRNEPPPSSNVERAATLAGQPVAPVRGMTGGAYVLRLFQPLPDAEAESLARYLESDPGSGIRGAGPHQDHPARAERHMLRVRRGGGLQWRLSVGPVRGGRGRQPAGGLGHHDRVSQHRRRCAGHRHPGPSRSRRPHGSRLRHDRGYIRGQRRQRPRFRSERPGRLDYCQ